jgi:hypothetical protein
MGCKRLDRSRVHHSGVRRSVPTATQTPTCTRSPPGFASQISGK